MVRPLHCYQFLKRPYSFEKETQKRPILFLKRDLKETCDYQKKDPTKCFSSSVVLSLLNNKHLNKFKWIFKLTFALLWLITFLKGLTYFLILYIALLPKNHTLEWQKKKRLKKRDPMQLFAEKGDFSNKKWPKRDPKSGLSLLRDLGLPKRNPVGSSGCGCKFYEEPNQKFELSKYSTILWTWKLLTWPQAAYTLEEHSWKAISHWLQWSEH